MINLWDYFRPRHDGRSAFNPPIPPAVINAEIEADLVEFRAIRDEPNPHKRGHMKRQLQAKIARRKALQDAQVR